ncbi:MAG: hypothetical protein U9P68_03650 [Pseudomonadota bacterium]|nr:hypothetical protein [Pseudomonadota bacterium]
MTQRKLRLLSTAFAALLIIPAAVTASPAEAQRVERGDSYGDRDRREHTRRDRAPGRDAGDRHRQRREAGRNENRRDTRGDGRRGDRDARGRGPGRNDARGRHPGRNDDARGRNHPGRNDARGRHPGRHDARDRRDQRRDHDWRNNRREYGSNRGHDSRRSAWERNRHRDVRDNRRDHRWTNNRHYRPGVHHDRRRWEYAQRRRDFYRDRARRQAQLRWIHHMNRGWSNSRHYGHWGPSNRWRYNTRYYSHNYDDRRFAYYDGLCRYDRNGSDGAIVGALLGALVGGAAAGDDNVGAGILLGAGFGAALGSGLNRLDNCDRAQYTYAMNYAFEYGEPYYWANPYSGVRGTIVVRETYYNAGRECRWGDAEIYMPDGTYNYDRVRMCRDAYGDWQVAHRQ